jgi:hypothetical protein
MAYEFSEGLAHVELKKRNGFVNLQGQLAVDTIFLHVQRFSQGLAQVNIGAGQAHKSIADACEVGFINVHGEFVIAPQFFAAGTFHNDLCLVETEREIGYINRTGEFIWRGKLVELGMFDPHHLLPPEVN